MTTEQILAHLRQTARGDSEVVLLQQEKVGLLERIVATQNTTIENLAKAVAAHKRGADNLQQIITIQADTIARCERMLELLRSGPKPADEMASAAGTESAT